MPTPTFAAARFAIVWVLAVMTLTAPAHGADLRISLPHLPAVAEDGKNGPLYRLAQAIAREWTEGKVEILGPLPFEQSVGNVVRGKADVHFPLIAPPAGNDDDLPYRYSSTMLYEVPFALYLQKGDTRINPAQITLASLAKLRIETESAHARLFYFRPGEAESIEAGLRRVSSGKSDGFLFSISATDPVLKRLKSTNLVRVPYRRFKSMMVLPKGPAGQELDEKLALIIDHLKDSGEYQKIMAPLLAQ